MDIKNLVSKQIWEDRYKKGDETVEGNIERVARYISKDEEEFKEKNRYLQYCDKFKSQCEGCKIKKFKDKYKKHVVPNCRDIYRYLKEKGEI